MTTKKLRKLTHEQLEQYDRDGYVLARGAAGPEVLHLARQVLERWVNDLVAAWMEQGLLKDPLSEVDFEHRLVQIWEAAGRPRYSRSPRRDLVSEEMFQFLTHPDLLDLAEDLLGTGEILSHSIFNGRPKAPDQKWTDTPWHQDAQYFRDAENVHVPTFWIPLQAVTEKNSCLQVAAGLHRGVLHEGYTDPETDFLGMTPEARRALQGISIEMQPGDVLCMTQKTPHRALANRSDAVRWSMDVRYEATPAATESGRKEGFVARSRANPPSLMPCEEWLKQWNSIVHGGY